MRWLAVLFFIGFLTVAFCDESPEKPEEENSKLDELNKDAISADDGEEEDEDYGEEEEDEGVKNKANEKDNKAETQIKKKGPKHWYGHYHSFYQKSKWCKCWIGQVYGKTIFSFPKFKLPGYSHYPKKPLFFHWPPKPDYQSWCSRKCSKYCTVKWEDKLHDYDTICKKLGTAYHWEYCTVGCFSRLLPNDRPNHIWDMDAHPGKLCCKPTYTCRAPEDKLDKPNKRCLKPVCKAPCLEQIPPGELNGFILIKDTFYKPYPWITGAEKVDCDKWKPRYDKYKRIQNNF